MNRRMFHRFIATLMLACGVVAASAATKTAERYIVHFSPGGEQNVRAAIGNIGGHILRTFPVRRLYAISLPVTVVNQIAGRPDVRFIEVDPKRYFQAEAVPYGIPMVQAAGNEALAENAASTRKVCIVDTGYDLGHEDLPMAGVSGDDGHDGYDTGDWFQDGHGHGTHVAGTIAAIGGNTVGVVGVNPGGQLPLHIVKVFTNQGNWAYGSDLIAAIDQCAAAGAQIVNMSLGGSGSSIAERDAFVAAHDPEQLNMLLFAAAGNSGSSALSYPASYDSVISVAGVDANEGKYVASQFNHQVELTGPAVAVTSTLPGDTYASWSGTSMATPHASGVGALVWGYFESCTAAQMRNALAAGAQNLGSPGRDSTFGYGLVKARDTYQVLQSGGCGVPAPEPPAAQALANGVPLTALSGSQHDEYLYQIDVPSGATDLEIQIYGSVGDADLYVRYGSRPATDLWDCRPYINGNSETCTEPTPTPGSWYVMLHGYLDYNDVTLAASFLEDAGGLAPVTHYPDADIPGFGTVSGSFADLRFNDGSLQEITESLSTGNPAKRTSRAEHQWRFTGVTGGAAVTLHLVAAVSANTEGDAFTLEMSTDGGASWTHLITIAPGGALKTHALPLPPSTSGTVYVRARDDDRSKGNQALDTIFLDRLAIETIPDGVSTPPEPPTLLSAEPGPDGVVLQWLDNSDNENRFDVSRAARDGAGWTASEVVGSTPADATSWIDGSVAANTTYRYEIIAVAGGLTANSAALEVTTPDGITLAATGYKVKGELRVDLSWSGGTGTLHLYRSVDGAGPTLLDAIEAGPGLYTDATNLKGGHSLTYTLCPEGAQSGDVSCSNSVTVSF